MSACDWLKYWCRKSCGNDYLRSKHVSFKKSKLLVDLLNKCRLPSFSADSQILAESTGLKYEQSNEQSKSPLDSNMSRVRVHWIQI